MGGGAPALGSSTGHQRVAQAFMVAWRWAAALWPFATMRIIGPHLHRFMLERAVEALVTGATQVFKDDDLLARSVELNLTTATKAASAYTTPRSDEQDTSDEEECEKLKVKEARNKRNVRATPRSKQASMGQGQKRFARLRQQR